jgi:hypothetical protein
MKAAAPLSSAVLSMPCSSLPLTTIPLAIPVRVELLILRSTFIAAPSNWRSSLSASVSSALSSRA